MHLLSEQDLDGILAALGVPVRCKGRQLRGILENDYQETQFGNMRVAGNAPQVMLKPSDIEAMALVYDDQVEVELNGEWSTYVVREQQPDGLGGFTTVRLIEAT